MPQKKGQQETIEPGKMVTLSSIVVAATALVGAAVAAPFNETALQAFAERSLTTSQTGWHGGYWFSFWTDGGGSVAYDNWDGGTYHVQWQNVGNWVGGKGWNQGSSRYGYRALNVSIERLVVLKLSA